jgi:hypothetical protein
MIKSIRVGVVSMKAHIAEAYVRDECVARPSLVHCHPARAVLPTMTLDTCIRAPSRQYPLVPPFIHSLI